MTLQDIYLPPITSETKTKSLAYKSAMDAAQNIISKLQVIDAEKQSEESPSASGEHFKKETTEALADPVEELRRYKALVDESILTEEEYAAKKRQILSI